jgi:hypothetical protein
VAGIVDVSHAKPKRTSTARRGRQSARERESCEFARSARSPARAAPRRPHQRLERVSESIVRNGNVAWLRTSPGHETFGFPTIGARQGGRANRATLGSGCFTTISSTAGAWSRTRGSNSGNRSNRLLDCASRRGLVAVAHEGEVAGVGGGGSGNGPRGAWGGAGLVAEGRFQEARGRPCTQTKRIGAD